MPYAVALVKLDEGPMVTAQLTDVGRGEVRIGMPVEMVTRRLAPMAIRGVNRLRLQVPASNSRSGLEQVH